ncbi:MAG: hypothetical protein JWO07_834 [Candidatus Saccharibacteria bacterium]|nr:hypothetical protein [Candidatus Saccharibacteria bacterium]
MTAALAPAPVKMTRIALPGRPTEVPYVAGATVEYYLKSLGATVAEGTVPVVGGLPATKDTVVDEDAAVSLAPKPSNG